MIELRSGEVVLRVDPTDGGRIVSLIVSGVERILPKARARATAPPIYWGCYPMVPWPGRLAEGRIPTDDGEVRLEPNLPPAAIHGLGFDKPWDVVERTDVRAPVRGIVIKLNQYTPGGVIAAGGVILELLPVNDEVIIEARVNPNDITYVTEGQHALVRLTGLNQRLTPMIEAKVLYLSADIVSDHSARRTNETDTTKRDSFIVRVQLDERDMLDKVVGFLRAALR